MSLGIPSAIKSTAGSPSRAAGIGYTASPLLGGSPSAGRSSSPIESIIGSMTKNQNAVPGSVQMLNGMSQFGAHSPASPLTPPPTAPGLPGQMDNKSQVNPVMQNVLDTLQGRAKGDMGASTAIRLAQGSSRDMLSGLLKELGQNASRRGVAGSGAETMAQGNLAGQAQRNMAGQAANISYGAEQDRNALLGNIGGMALNSDSSQRSDRALALQQWESEQQAAQQAYQSQLAAWNYNQQNQLSQQRMDIDRTNNLLNILRVPLF